MKILGTSTEKCKTLRFSEALAACEAQGVGRLSVAVGRKANGKFIFHDLSDPAHLLVGGGAGTGKSAFLHALICTLVSRTAPDELRLVLCDPKGSEFAGYAGTPHLLTKRPFTDAAEIPNALRWAAAEAERRLSLFAAKAAAGEVRDIDGYNAYVRAEERLPRLVVVLDEFFGLAAADVLAALSGERARAAGVSLVLATQFALPDILMHVSDMRFPARISFRVAQEADSFAFFGEGGAQLLRGRGELLYRTASESEHAQAAFLTLRERAAVVAEAKMRYAAQFDAQAAAFIGGKSV